MRDKLHVMIGSENLARGGTITGILQSKGLGLTLFQSVRQACTALKRSDLFLLFCEKKFSDGTYEDLLAAAKQAGSRARIVVAPSGTIGVDSTVYEKAKNLGAFDVLREYYGPRDVEWLVTCALREEKIARAAAASPNPQYELGFV